MPYQRYKNIGQWIADKQARKELGLIGGMIVFKGLYLTPDEYSGIKPVELESSSVQLDGRSIFD